MQVAFHCGCGTVIQVNPATVGRWMRCPVCRRKISRSELQGPRAKLITEAESVGSSGPAGTPVWVAPAQPSLPWKWIGAAAAALLFLLLGLLGLSLWEHISSKLLAQQDQQEESSSSAAAKEKPPSSDSGAAPGETKQPTSPPAAKASPDGKQPQPSAPASGQVPPQDRRPPAPKPASSSVPVPESTPRPQPSLQARPPASAASQAAGPAAPVSWQRVVDRQGAFEILFPQGRISREQTAGVYGPLFMQLALTRWGEFRVIYTDFPQSVPLRGMNDVQRAFGPMLQELYGPVQGYPRPIQLHGFPGMMLRFAKGEKQTLARVFLVRRRVYLVLWTGRAQPPWLDRFFASFDLPWARR